MFYVPENIGILQTAIKNIKLCGEWSFPFEDTFIKKTNRSRY